ncbi:MAG: hypothetical protein AAGI68_08745 [Planctomycetota bacterium]
MAVREYLNNNPAVVTIAAVVLLIVCLALIVRQLLGGGGGQARDLFYLDTGSGQIFVQEITPYTPIDAPSGPGNGVRAHIYACGDCEGIASDLEAGMTIGDIEALGAKLVYVERFPPDVVAELKAAEASADPEASMVDQEQLYMQREVAVIQGGAVQAWQSADMTGVSGNPDDSWDVVLGKIFQELCSGGERPTVCLPPR